MHFLRIALLVALTTSAAAEPVVFLHEQEGTPRLAGRQWNPRVTRDAFGPILAWSHSYGVSMDIRVARPGGTPVTVATESRAWVRDVVVNADGIWVVWTTNAESIFARRLDPRTLQPAGDAVAFGTWSHSVAVAAAPQTVAVFYESYDGVLATFLTATPAGTETRAVDFADRSIYPLHITAEWSGSEFVVAWTIMTDQSTIFATYTELYARRVSEDGQPLESAPVTVDDRHFSTGHLVSAPVAGGILLAWQSPGMRAVHPEGEAETRIARLTRSGLSPVVSIGGESSLFDLEPYGADFLLLRHTDAGVETLTIGSDLAVRERGISVIDGPDPSPYVDFPGDSVGGSTPFLAYLRPPGPAARIFFREAEPRVTRRRSVR